MLIVVALVAIILAISVPSFSKIIERMQLRESAEAVKADLELARTQAIKGSQNVTFDTNTGNNGTWCYGFNNSATDCDCTQADPTQADYCAMKRVTGSEFSSTNMTSNGITPITFDFRRGTVLASNVCLASNNYIIKVLNNNVGRVSICSDTKAPMGGYEDCAPSNCPPIP